MYHNRYMTNHKYWGKLAPKLFRQGMKDQARISDIEPSNLINREVR